MGILKYRVAWTRAAAVGFLLLALAGCGKPTARMRVSDYFPAMPGMEWHYAGKGNEFATYSVHASHRDGDRAQFVTYSGAVLASVYEIRPDRVVLRLTTPLSEGASGDLLDSEGKGERTVLEAPLQVGHEWTVGAAGEKRTIAAVGVDVVTPAGRFENALKVHVESGKGPGLDEWYAPGVGLVRREFLSEEPVVSELDRFSIR